MTCCLHVRSNPLVFRSVKIILSIQRDKPNDSLFTLAPGLLCAALIDKNGDGIIDYQEFMPVCFSMIVEILSDKVPLAGASRPSGCRMCPIRAETGRKTMPSALR